LHARRLECRHNQSRAEQPERLWRCWRHGEIEPGAHVVSREALTNKSRRRLEAVIAQPILGGYTIDMHESDFSEATGSECSGDLQPYGIRLPARERDQPFRCYRQRGTRTVRVHAQKERKPGSANAGHPDRHGKPRAELTGAAGSHTSSTRRVRHCWLADIGLAPA
jgi:hypothetical protein